MDPYPQTAKNSLKKDLYRLIAPLKPGLRLVNSFRFEGLDELEGDRSTRLLFRSTIQGTTFAVRLFHLPLGGEEPSEAVTEFFHLRRERVEDAPFPEGSEKVLKPLTLLIEKNESNAAKPLLDRWSVRGELKKAVDNKIYLRITLACQLDCVFCAAKEELDSTYLDHKQVLAAIEKAKIAERSIVIFSGGEPTLNPRLQEYVKRVFEMGANFIIVQSNGIRLGEPGFLDAFVPYKDKLAFGLSIHAAHEKTAARVSNRKDLLKAQWAGFQAAMDNGFLTSVTLVLTKPVLSELRIFIDKTIEEVGSRDNFKILYIAFPVPMGNAHVNKMMMPTLTEAMDALLTTLENLSPPPFSIRFSETASIPRCVFYSHGAEHLLEHLEAYDDITEVNPNERRFGSRCSACRFRSVCPGVWHRYLDEFGEDELVPVPQSKE